MSDVELDGVGYTTLSHRWATVGVNAAVQLGIGPNGQNAIRTGQNANCRKNLRGNPSLTTVLYAARVRWNGVSNTNMIFMAMCENATRHVDLRVDTNQKLIVTRNGTAIGSPSAQIFTFDVWHYIEFLAVISDTVGVIEVRVDGDVYIANTTGLDTRNGGSGIVNSVESSATTNTISTSVDVCDIRVRDDSTFKGDTRIIVCRPNAAGDLTDWTPTAGANYTNVDEADANDDTDYVRDGTVGHQDLYDHAAVGVVGTVHSVQQVYRHRKDDAGARTLRGILKTGGTIYNGGTISAADTYQSQVEAPRETNPNTGLAWVTSDVDALQGGVEVIS